LTDIKTRPILLNRHKIQTTKSTVFGERGKDAMLFTTTETAQQSILFLYIFTHGIRDPKTPQTKTPNNYDNINLVVVSLSCNEKSKYTKYDLLFQSP